MSVYEPNSRHLRKVLIFRFNIKNLLFIKYLRWDRCERTCREWFQCFKNSDSDIEDRHGGGRKKVFKDAELEALLYEDSYQRQEELVGLLIVTQQTISKYLKAMRYLYASFKLRHWFMLRIIVLWFFRSPCGTNLSSVWCQDVIAIFDTLSEVSKSQ